MGEIMNNFGISLEELKSIFEEGAKQAGSKSTKKTVTIKVKTDGVDAVTKEMQALNEEVGKFQNFNQVQRNQIKFFGSQEKVIKQLKKSWEEYQAAVAKGDINKDGSISDKVNKYNLKSVKDIRSNLIHMASIAELSLGDQYSAIADNISKELKGAIKNLYNDSAYSNYSAAPEKIKPLYDWLLKVKDAAEKAGVSLEDALNNSGIDKLKEFKLDYKEISKAADGMEKVSKTAEKVKKDVSDADIFSTEKAESRINSLNEKLDKFYNRMYKNGKETEVEFPEKQLKNIIEMFYELEMISEKSGKKINENFETMFGRLEAHAGEDIDIVKQLMQSGKKAAKERYDRNYRLWKAQAESSQKDSKDNKPQKTKSKQTVKSSTRTTAAGVTHTSTTSEGESTTTGGSGVSGASARQVTQIGENAKSAKTDVDNLGDSIERAGRSSSALDGTIKKEKEIAEEAKKASDAMEEQKQQQEKPVKPAQDNKPKETAKPAQQPLTNEKSKAKAINDEADAQAKLNEEMAKKPEAPKETVPKTLKEQYEEVLQVIDALEKRQKDIMDMHESDENNAYKKVLNNEEAAKANEVKYGKNTLSTQDDYKRVIGDAVKKEGLDSDKAIAYWGRARELFGDKQFRSLKGKSGKDVTEYAISRYEELKQIGNKNFDELNKELTNINLQLMKKREEAEQLKKQLGIQEPVSSKTSRPKQTKETPKQSEQPKPSEEPSWKTGMNEKEISAVEAYIKRMKSLQKEAYNEAQALQQALDKLNKIKTGDVGSIMETATSADTPTSKMVEIMTGMPVNNKTAREAALKSINPDEYAKIIQQQTEAAQQELDKQKNSFKDKWNEVADAMIGGDAFADAKPIEKGRIIKELEKYGDTAKDAIDEINKQWLSGTLDTDKFSGKYAQLYIAKLDLAKEAADFSRESKAGDIDPDSLFNEKKGTIALTQERVDALHAEAAAYDELIAKKREYYGIVDPKKEIGIFEEDADTLFSDFDVDKSKSEYDGLFAAVENGAKTAKQALKELGEAFGMVYNSADRDWSVSPKKIADDNIQRIADSLRKGDDGTYQTSNQLFSATKAKGGYDVKAIGSMMSTHVKTLAEAKQAIAQMINDSFSSIEKNINVDLDAGVINAEEAANRLSNVKAFVLEAYGDLTKALSDESGKFLVDQIQSGKLSYSEAFNLFDEGTVGEYQKQIEQVEKIKSDIQELLSQTTGTRAQGEFQIDVLTRFLNDLTTDLGLTESEVSSLKEQIQTRIANIKQTMEEIDKQPRSTGLNIPAKAMSKGTTTQPAQEETDPIKKELQSQIDFVMDDIQRAKKAILQEDPDGLLHSIFYGIDGKLKNVDFEKELDLARTQEELFGDQDLADKLANLPKSLIGLYDELYLRQSDLDELQKNGLSYLQKEADIRKNIASVQQANANEELDAHTLQISDEDAKTKLETLEQTVEKIQSIRAETQALESAQPFMIADTDDLKNEINGLDEIEQKLKSNIDVLKTYKEVQREYQYNIWMDFADQFTEHDLGEGNAKLNRLKSDIDTAMYDGKFTTGQQAIEEFKKQAKELGFVLDETGKKWVEISEVSGNNTVVSSEQQTGKIIDRNNQSLKERLEYLKLLKSESKFMETADERKSDMEDKAWDVGGNNPRATEAQSQGLIKKYEDHVARMESANELIDGFENGYERVIVTLKNGDEVVIKYVDDLEELSLALNKIKDIKFVPFTEEAETSDEVVTAEREQEEQAQRTAEAERERAEATEKANAEQKGMSKPTQSQPETHPEEFEREAEAAAEDREEVEKLNDAKKESAETHTDTPEVEREGEAYREAAENAEKFADAKKEEQSAQSSAEPVSPEVAKFQELETQIDLVTKAILQKNDALSVEGTTASQVVASEIALFEQLETQIDLVTKAVLQKNDAFSVEGTTVSNVVSGEVSEIQKLETALTGIAESLAALDIFFKELGDNSAFAGFAEMIDKIKSGEDALKSFAEILKKSKKQQEEALKNAENAKQVENKPEETKQSSAESIEKEAQEHEHAAKAAESHAQAVEKVNEAEKQSAESSKLAEETKKFIKESQKVFEEFGISDPLKDAPLEWQEHLNMISNEGKSADEVLQHLRETLENLGKEEQNFNSGKIRKGDVYLNQQGIVGEENNYGFTVKRGFAQKEMFKHEVDENGIETWTSGLSTNFESLEKEVLKVDSIILRLQNDLENAVSSGKPTDGIRKQLEYYGDYYNDLIEELERYYKENDYMPDSYQVRDFNERRRKQGMLTSAQIQAMNEARYDRDWQAAIKENQKIEKQKQKDIETTNALIIKQQGNLDNLKKKYVDNAGVDLAEQDIEKLEAQYKKVKDLLDKIRGRKTTDTEKAEINTELKEYQRLAQQAIKNQKTSMQLEADRPDVARERLKSDIQQLLNEMKQSAADTTKQKQELEDILKQLGGEYDPNVHTSDWLKQRSQDYKSIKQQNRGIQNEYKQEEKDVNRYAELMMKKAVETNLSGNEQDELNKLIEKYEILNNKKKQGLEISSTEEEMLKRASKAREDADNERIRLQQELQRSVEEYDYQQAYKQRSDEKEDEQAKRDKEWYDMEEAYEKERAQKVKESYDKQIAAIKELNDAKSAMNDLQAQKQSDPGIVQTQLWTDAVERLKKAFIEATTARKMLTALHTQGDITDEQLKDSEEMYKRASKGSAESQNNLRKAKLKADAAIDKEQKKANDEYLKEQVSEIEKYTKELNDAYTNMNKQEAKRIAAGDNGDAVARTNEYREAVIRLTEALDKEYEVRQRLEGLKGILDDSTYNALTKGLDTAAPSSKSQDDIMRAGAKAIENEISEYMKVFKEAENLQTQLNNTLADQTRGKATEQDVVNLREKVEQARQAADEAAASIAKLLEDGEGIINPSRVNKLTQDAIKAYDKAYIGSDASNKRMHRAVDYENSKQTKGTLDEYNEARATYQKLYQKSELDNKALSTDEIKQMEGALSRIVDIENNWNEAKSKNVSLTEKQAKAHDDILKGKQNGAEYTKQELEDNAAQQSVLEKYNKLRSKITKMYDQKEWRANKDEWTATVADLEKQLGQIDVSAVNSEKYQEAMKDLEKIAQLQQEIQKSSDWQPVAKDWQTKSLADVAKWMDQNKIAAKEFGEELERLKQDIYEVGSKGMAEEWSARYQDIQRRAAEGGFLGKSLGDRFKDQFKNTMTSLATYYLSFQDFIRYGREAINIIVELDTAMTNLKKVADDSATSFDKFRNTAFDIAKETGSTATGVIDAATEWARLGYSLEDSAKLSKASVIYSNVGEIDATQATTDLVSVLKAFKMDSEDALHAVDVLNEIGI